MGEREQAGVRGSRSLEEGDGGLHEPAGDALVPQLGTHRQWTEEPDAAPAGQEVAAHHLSVALGGESGTGVGEPASADVVLVAEQPGHAGERVEGRAHDRIGRGQVALAQFAHVEVGLLGGLGQGVGHGRSIVETSAAIIGEVPAPRHRGGPHL